MTTSDNKRIAKNTVLLYLRMFLLFCVNFYITRVLLQNLGVDDFGLNNVVAGFVSMLGFVNQSMTNSIQRFLNFQFGKNDIEGVKKYFENSLFAQLTLSIIILLLIETAGVWFLNNKMNIPQDRFFVSNVILQCSALTVLVNMIKAPYSALIIAKERMDFYAWISIIEVVVKMLIALAIVFFEENKLIVYSSLLVLLTIMLFFATMLYCGYIQPNIKFRISHDRKILNEVLSFSGWNLFGSGSEVVKSQGINILMNMFFNVTVNAARGVAFQVLGGVQQFTSNFQVAINPQIVQSYAADNMARYKQLTYSSAKLSFYLMWCIALPVILCIKPILSLWLGENVPEFTDVFVNIILLTGLIDSLGSSISVPIYATGTIKIYQIVVSSIKLLILPISYILYRFGYPPQTSMYVSLIMSMIAQTARVIIWSNLVDEPIHIYGYKIVVPAIFISAISFVCSYLAQGVIPKMSELLYVLLTIFITLVINIICVYLIGLDKSERQVIYKLIKR